MSLEELLAICVCLQGVDVLCGDSFVDSIWLDGGVVLVAIWIHCEEVLAWVLSLEELVTKDPLQALFGFKSVSKSHLSDHALHNLLVLILLKRVNWQLD